MPQLKLSPRPSTAAVYVVLIASGQAHAAPEGTPSPSAETLPTVTREPQDLEPEEPTPVDPRPLAPIAVELERAKESYFDGGHREAMEILTELRQRIDAGEVVSRQTRGEIGTYLGELHLLFKDQESAWRTFRWLLLEEPDYPILPALHPPEVVTWFEAVRAEVLAEIEASRPPPPPLTEPIPYPWWGLAPFGAPQLGQGQLGKGIAYGLGQGVSAGISAGMFTHLIVVNRRGHPSWLEDDDVAPYVRRWRNGVQWPSTALFYGLWVASALDGQARWRRDGHVQVVPAVAADGASLHLGGRF
jgi:hypothetical protein